MLVPSIASHRGRVRTPSVLPPRPSSVFSGIPPRSFSLSFPFCLSFLILVPSAILIYLSPLFPPNAVLGRVLPSRASSFLPFHPFSLCGYGSTSTRLLRTRRYANVRAYNSSRGGRGRRWSGQDEKEGVVNGIRATARKAKVIEHDLSVGRNFYRRPPPLKVAVTTFAALLGRAHASARIYAHPMCSTRSPDPNDEGLIVNFTVDSIDRAPTPGDFIADPRLAH